MKKPGLVYYNAIIATHRSNFHLPGIEKFSWYFTIYNPGVSPVDRTHTLRFPIRTHSLFPMPPFAPLSDSYESICNERALELLKRASRLGIELYVFWSGGIDSTLVLTSLLKNATENQKNNIVVLMSEDSILENPNFYRDHVHGKLRRESAALFPYLLGKNCLMVNGEHQDQIFGSDIVATVMNRFGADVIHKPYDRSLFTVFFSERTGEEYKGKFYVALFERLKNASPVEIVTNYDMFWWINFALKWQTVYTRTLSYVAERNVTKITKEYLDSNYAPFYNTEKFQLWSMNNMTSKIKKEWRTYKWPAKEIIYDFTKDVEYRDNKIKRGSLYNLILHQMPFNFIDESIRFSKEMDPVAYFEPVNDFI